LSIHGFPTPPQVILNDGPSRAVLQGMDFRSHLNLEEPVSEEVSDCEVDESQSGSDGSELESESGSKVDDPQSSHTLATTKGQN